MPNMFLKAADNERVLAHLSFLYKITEIRQVIAEILLKEVPKICTFYIPTILFDEKLTLFDPNQIKVKHGSFKIDALIIEQIEI